ncbi:glycosyltransferase [Patescibacteria group bacterium]
MSEAKKIRVVHMLATYNEKDNIGPMIEYLEKMAKGLPRYEFVILVADSKSPDGTGEVVKKMAKTRKNLHFIETPRGLGISLIKAYQYSVKQLKADIVIPNDADFQWDPKLIPQLLKKLEEGYDVAVPSRHIKGGRSNFNAFRKLTHFVSNDLVNYYWGGIREVKDLAGNFKAIRVKGVLDKVELEKLNVKGFVIQSTMIYELSKTGAKFCEIPAIYGERRSGEAKVGFNLQFVKDVFETVLNATKIRMERSQEFVKVCVVGFIGAVVQYSIFNFLRLSLEPAVANTVAVGAAIISNFTLNNVWTFKESKIAFFDFKKLLPKFMIFIMISFGSLLIQFLVMKVGVALLGRGFIIENGLVAVGILIGLIWNFTMYKKLIWKTKHSSSKKKK